MLNSCKLRPKRSESWTAFYLVFWSNHHLPLSIGDHFDKLFRNMFSDSKIVSKHRCGLMKTTHMLTGALAKQITSNLKEELLLTCWYKLPNCDEDDKFFSVLGGQVDKDSGLIAKSLLNIPDDINSGSIPHQMRDVSNEVREALSLV